MTETPEINRVVWASESDHPEQSEKLRTALHEVKDPEIGMSVIQLGLIRDVTIQPERVMIKMILTTPFCPYGPALIEETRSTAEAALGISTVIDLSMDVWDFSMMEEPVDPEWGLF